MPRVQIWNELIGYERIEKDVQQGCIISECVFKLYIQMILRELDYVLELLSTDETINIR